ncbi:MAG: TonB-dependent receptor plug domain-containing protein [Desulfovibrionales bacterium]|nr:TonB-dependent receptor plug domain-containing protein [Desulfovibrionales bacterium]
MKNTIGTSPFPRDKNQCLSLLLTFIILALVLVEFGPVSAGEAKHQSGTTAKRTGYKMENMMVTAQKQEENIQDIPVSITVLDSLLIEDAKIESVLDLADYIPNFSINESGNSGINTPTTRGLHATMESGTVTTGLFVDGVPILSSTGFEASFYDIERVEFLRGPQGTLYGNGAEAGVINIITRQPDNEFRGKFSLNAGQYLSSKADDNLYNTSFYFSGPIARDTLFFGISG